MSQRGKLTPNLDKESTKMLNLTVLQRMDSFIEEILITAAHVTFYEFNVDSNAWGRKDVEGSLFVVKRNAQPRFQFIVMNRRNTENLVENLLGDFEYELQLPYLLYKNAAQEVNGIWFYNAQECEDVANLFSRIFNAYSKVSPNSIVPSGKGDFEKLEVVPTTSPLEVPLEEAASTSSTVAPDSSFIHFFSAAVNIGESSSKMTDAQLPHFTAANISPACVSSPVPSQQMPPSSPASSLTPFLLYGAPDSICTTGVNDLIKPSSFAPSSSASAMMMSSIALPLPTPAVASHHHPLNVQRPYGAPLLQPFPPPTPPASLAPGSIPAIDTRPFLNRDRVRDALQILVQDDQFIDKFYQALLKVRH